MCVLTGIPTQGAYFIFKVGKYSKNGYMPHSFGVFSWCLMILFHISNGNRHIRLFPCELIALAATVAST